jgi:hypothetical protein
VKQASFAPLNHPTFLIFRTVTFITYSMILVQAETEATMWDFKFSRRRVWCSELSSGLYCSVSRKPCRSTIILHGSITQKTALNRSDNVGHPLRKWLEIEFVRCVLENFDYFSIERSHQFVGWPSISNTKVAKLSSFLRRDIDSHSQNVKHWLTWWVDVV